MGLRHLVPRVSSTRLLWGAALLAPAVLLGALSNALLILELARLDVVPRAGIIDVEALLAFKTQTEALMIGTFLAAALGALILLHVGRRTVAPNAYAAGLLVLLAVVVAARWDLGLTQAATRIGLAAALWGVSWGLVALQLFAFLRNAPHRRWLWITGAVSLLFFATSLVLFLLAWLVTVEVMAVFVALVGVTLAAFVFARRDALGEEVGSGAGAPRLPRVSPASRPLVVVWAVLVFGLMGAAYQYHFDYRPVQPLSHHLLMMLAAITGVALFGALNWHGGRRTLLWAVPGATGAAVLLQAGFVVRWPAAVALGLMLGVVFYLLQYVMEVTQRQARLVLFGIAFGAVAVMGVGGSVVAQLPALRVFTPERILVLQVAALLVAFLLTPQLPETEASQQAEEALEEYLEIARRVQEEQ